MKMTLSLINHETVRFEDNEPLPAAFGDKMVRAVELRSIKAVLIVELEPTTPPKYRPSIMRCLILTLFFRRDVSKETLMTIQDRMARLRIF